MSVNIRNEHSNESQKEAEGLSEWELDREIKRRIRTHKNKIYDEHCAASKPPSSELGLLIISCAAAFLALFLLIKLVKWFWFL